MLKAFSSGEVIIVRSGAAALGSIHLGFASGEYCHAGDICICLGAYDSLQFKHCYSGYNQPAVMIMLDDGSVYWLFESELRRP